MADECAKPYSNTNPMWTRPALEMCRDMLAERLAQLSANDTPSMWAREINRHAWCLRRINEMLAQRGMREGHDPIHDGLPEYIDVVING